MLETVDKVKWKTPGHVKDEEEEKKVCVGRSCVPTLRTLPSHSSNCLLSFHPAPNRRAEAAAGETSGTGGRGVPTEAAAGHRDEGPTRC